MFSPTGKERKQVIKRERETRMPASQVHGSGRGGLLVLQPRSFLFRFVRGAHVVAPLMSHQIPLFAWGTVDRGVPPVFRLPPTHTITRRPHRTALSTVHDGLCRLRRATRRRGRGKDVRERAPTSQACSVNPTNRKQPKSTQCSTLFHSELSNVSCLLCFSAARHIESQSSQRTLS